MNIKKLYIFLLLLTLLPILLISDNLNMKLEKIKKEKEIQYMFLNQSGIKNIEFDNGFYRITFNDKKVFCENNTIITDNCNVIFNKKEVIDNVYSTLFVKKLLHSNLKDKFMDKQLFGNKNIYYLINPFSKKYDNLFVKNKKKQQLLEKLSIIYIPKKVKGKEYDWTLKDLNKKLNQTITKKELKQFNKMLKKDFKLPITVILK